MLSFEPGPDFRPCCCRGCLTGFGPAAHRGVRPSDAHGWTVRVNCAWPAARCCRWPSWRDGSAVAGVPWNQQPGPAQPPANPRAAGAVTTGCSAAPKPAPGARLGPPSL